jgi:membrane protein YqaA with SNARE-associated domain
VTAEEIVAAVGIYAGTFVVAAVGSVVPIVSIEVFLVALTLAHGPGDAVPIVLLATAGQLTGKLPIYAAARGVAALPSQRLQRLRAWAARREHGAPIILGSSALLGLPPFSIMATAAGVLAIRLRTFCIVVAIGRAARFAAIIAATSHAS